MLPIAVQPLGENKRSRADDDTNFDSHYDISEPSTFPVHRTMTGGRDGCLLFSTEGFCHSHDGPYIEELQTPLQPLPATNRNEEQVGAVLKPVDIHNLWYGMGLLQWRLQQQNTE